VRTKLLILVILLPAFEMMATEYIGASVGLNLRPSVPSSQAFLTFLSSSRQLGGVNDKACKMQAARSAGRLCDACSTQLLYIFKNGFCTTTKLPSTRRELWSRSIGHPVQDRHFSHRTLSRQHAAPTEDVSLLESSTHPVDMEAIVHQARQTFGETLPLNFLSSEEYSIYERLYGPPSEITPPEDVRVLQELVARDEQADAENNLLYREDEEGNLEEVVYEDTALGGEKGKGGLVEPIPGIEDHEGPQDVLSNEGSANEEKASASANSPESGIDDFEARMAQFKEIAATNRAQALSTEQNEANATEEAYEKQYASEETQENRDEAGYEQSELEDREAEEGDEEDGDIVRGDAARTHPMTAAARSGTSPSTLQLPKSTVVEPIMALLRDASNKHMKEIAYKAFGGAGLPNSTATPSTAERHLQQAPIALEASQRYMGDMEANVYLGAIMPGAYASIMHTLVEVRKRLGSHWLQNLMKKDGGPRILDAGTAGAGVQAWREVLRAEWQTTNSDGVPPDKPAPLGKAAVVTGSNELRHRVSKLLENTTFLPRLPDYNPSRDHPTLGTPNAAQPRKQYDVIIAPHTLWGLRQDYMRKNQVQNFWSLLNPNGGVLVIIEKGVPRGFELVAAAREMLLKRHISSTELTHPEPLEDGEPKYGPKEKGMIIAPCTNHAQCPMYTTPGKSTGRKDLCHFSQRFLRPRYLQTLLGSRERNHEDIKFSYIAVQRGVDQRELHGIVQGSSARDAAFAGYEDRQSGTDAEMLEKGKALNRPSPHTLSLPRTVLHPIKRRGHVILDLCTPAGRIERWTVPKSFSMQAYRDARKSQWGDLWALGAKTSISRNIRLGTKDKKTKGKNIYELDASPSSTDDLTHVSGPKAKFEKRTKKGRQLNQRKKLTEDDF